MLVISHLKEGKQTDTIQIERPRQARSYMRWLREKGRGVSFNIQRGGGPANKSEGGFFYEMLKR
jgi:hypothetical protein